MNRDERIADVCLAAVRRNSTDTFDWKYTRIEAIHLEFSNQISIADEEIPIVSSFISEGSWFLVTTRKVTGTYGGNRQEIAAEAIGRCDFGLFKRGRTETEVMTIHGDGNQELKLEFERGKAAQSIIYAIGTLGAKAKRT